MCGFVGVFNGGSERNLDLATQAIAHRGPDGSGVRWFPALHCGIGHRRLSIIDLSDQASQPMHDPETGNWIVFNGEIYNYKEIRTDLISRGIAMHSDSDTEVVLKSYHLWGRDCLNRLNGMFAFLILNEHSGDLFGARDRIGIKPFYYHFSHGLLIAASEIKAILEFNEYRKEPDLFSLLTPVHYQAGPYTGFRDVLKLLPGHCIEYRSRSLSVSQWWKLKPKETIISDREAEDRLDQLLQDSVKLQMVADVPVGLLLSGGLDSSLIGVMMDKINQGNLHTFTISFTKEDLKKHGNVDDAAFARKIAAEKGFHHHEIMLKPDIIDLLPKMIGHLDEPLADPSVINIYLICKAAREHGIYVLQTGIGADEVFSGYRSALACLKGGIYASVPAFLRRGLEKLMHYVPQQVNGRSIRKVRYLKKFLHFAGLPPFERYLASLNTALTREDFRNYYLGQVQYEETVYFTRNLELYNSNKCSYLTKMSLNDTSIYLPDHNLTYSDKGSMATGVELRPAFLDHRLVEFIFTLPPKMRIRNNVQKYLLKKVAERHLPHTIIYRPKAPFSAPMRSWLKGELAEMVDDLLCENNIIRRGIYNPDFVRRLVKEDRAGTEDHSQLIFRLVVNELWFRQHFEN